MMGRTAATATVLTLAAAAAPLPLASATTDASFTKQANAACSTEGAKVKALPKITDDNALSVLKKESTIVRSLVTKLKKISAPQAKATKFKSFIAANQKGGMLIDQAIAAAKAQDAAKLKSVTKQLDQAGDRSDALAKSLKLSACAKSYSADG
jgi:hypothetical protein